MAYILGGMAFSSKQAIAEHARHIKDTTPVGTILEGQPFEFMCDLLRWHPDAADKIGVGVRAIQVRKNPMFKHPEFYLHRVDGTGTDFSYKQCTMPSSPMADFTAACRVAIVEQIIAFRDRTLGTRQTCPLTGEKLDKNNSHVDHKPPRTFARLLADFTKSEKIDGRKVKISGRAKDNSFRLSLADDKLRTKWQDYHRDNAELRLISKTANLMIVGKEWDVMLDYLQAVNYKDAVIEWKGKRMFYTQPEGVNRGIFMLAERAPEKTPLVDGAIILIEASLKAEVDMKDGAA